MNLRTTIIAVGLALLSANSGRVVEAGYVSTGLVTVRGDTTAIDLNFGEGAGQQESPSPAKEVAPEQQPPSDAVAMHRLATFGSSTSGMAPPAPETSGTQPVISLQGGTAQTLHLWAWLGAEGRAALPPPISTRIFRPPRVHG